MKKYQRAMVGNLSLSVEFSVLCQYNHFLIIPANSLQSSILLSAGGVHVHSHRSCYRHVNSSTFMLGFTSNSLLLIALEMGLSFVG